MNNQQVIELSQDYLMPTYGQLPVAFVVQMPVGSNLRRKGAGKPRIKHV